MAARDKSLEKIVNSMLKDAASAIMAGKPYYPGGVPKMAKNEDGSDKYGVCDLCGKSMPIFIGIGDGSTAKVRDCDEHLFHTVCVFKHERQDCPTCEANQKAKEAKKSSSK